MRLEGFVVERDAARCEFLAHALGEFHELGDGRDVEPKRRVARTLEFAQPVTAQRDGRLTSAGDVSVFVAAVTSFAATSPKNANVR